MSFGKLQSQGQNFVSRLGGATVLTPQQQAQLTPEQLQLYNQQKEMARSAGMKELSARLSDAFAGRDVAGRALEREKLRQVKDTRTAFQKNIDYLMSRGYSFEEANNILKQGTTIQFPEGEREFQKEATKSAFRTLEKAQEQVDQFVDIEGRLNILQKQLQGGELETGIFEPLRTPFQRLAAGLNILSQDELKNLGSKELFERTVNYVVPRLRVSGSGSTSDTEVQLFRESAPSLQLEEGGNLLIVGGMSAVAKHNRDRLNLMNKYIEDPNLGDGDLIGFGEYADRTLGPVFKSYDSDQSFDKQVKEGKLKPGDFVYDGIYGEFRILTDEDIRGAQ